MKNRTSLKYLIPCFLIISILSCKDDDPQLRLISPVESTESYTGNLLFTWEKASPEGSRLQISETPNYISWIFDTTLADDQFEYTHKLIPGQDYYWVLRNGAFKASSSFTIEDILSKYDGTFELNALKRDWAAGNGIIAEENYDTEIQIIKEGVKVKVIENSSNLNSTMTFDPSIVSGDSFISYSKSNNDDSYLIIDTETDSVRIFTRTGNDLFFSIYIFSGTLDL